MRRHGTRSPAALQQTAAIADLGEHKNSTVTSRVYRHQLRPVITQGAEAMDAIFDAATLAETATTDQDQWRPVWLLPDSEDRKRGPPAKRRNPF